ncbi:protein LAZ1 [Tanacetum coccineum]
MKDVGPFHYYLGMTQRKYALELLECANVLDSKPAAEPMDPILKLSSRDGYLLRDPSTYLQNIRDFNLILLSHKSIKRRNQRSRIDVVTTSDNVEATGVSDDSNTNMVRPVTNDEIKRVMFDIGDDKAPGPDGYTKILTNRIIEGIKEVVSENQSAFVSGRRISDNILIMHELMYNYHRNRGPPRCAFKVDIQKAINGNIDGLFKGKRGLRQGDPLSPYLFTLVMEILTLILQRRVRSSESFRYHNHCELPLKYLSVPLISSRLLNKDCKVLVEKAHNRIGDWKNKSLSFADILQLYLVLNRAWNWPHAWLLKAPNLSLISAPSLDGSRQDCTRWRDRNGNLTEFSVKSAWEAIRPRGPLNNALRDEEGAYVRAFIEAKFDEERFLRQKEKIQWLDVGDSNSSYFHKSIKRRNQRSRIDVVTTSDNVEATGKKLTRKKGTFMLRTGRIDPCMLNSDTDHDVTGAVDGSARSRLLLRAIATQSVVTWLAASEAARKRFIRKFVEDLGGWPSNKGVSDDSNTNMVRPVTNDEIKRVMFDIGDDKAPGPDGYTSTFFKKDGISDNIPYQRIELLYKVSPASFSLSINGNIDGLFKGKRGLRQGDPLSPYLFTLVMEILTLILQRRVRSSESVNFENLLRNSNWSRVWRLHPLFLLCELPLKYLGFPLISSRLLNKDCKVLVEKAHNRIGDWKNKSLSFAGRLQLCLFGAMAIKKAEKLRCLGSYLSSFPTRRGMGLCNLVLNRAWNWPHAWLLKAPNLSLISAPSLDGSRQDCTRWRDRNGNLTEFSVKSAWEAIRPRGNEVLWHHTVWFSDCIPRHDFHIWLVMRRSLKTQDTLRHWDVDASTDLSLLRCSLCDAQQDSHEHLFFECAFSSQVWCYICGLAGMEHVSLIFVVATYGFETYI